MGLRSSGTITSLRQERRELSTRLGKIRPDFASRALAPGEGLPTIGLLLGHRQLDTTARYAHLTRDSVRESAERIPLTIAADIL